MMKPLRITAAIAIFFGAFGVLEAHEGHSHGHSHGDEETAHAVLAESVQELYPRVETPAWSAPSSGYLCYRQHRQEISRY